MKFSITLATIFALFFYCQALPAFLEFKIQNLNMWHVKGQIDGQLTNKKITQEFNFTERYFHAQETFYYQCNFEGDIDTIKFTWKTNSTLPVYFRPLILTRVNDKKELDKSVFLPDKKIVFKGETVTYKEA